MIKNRIYGNTRDISIEELKKAFSQKSLEYIKVALLFGSRATNRANPKSDYDFILFFDDISEDWGVVSKAWCDLEDILKLAEYDFDIIDLKRANKAIKNSIK